ncbi:MAG: hypothetical protein JXO22_02940 [Phycisphaerae bacterium]|nr:hypothetical protein [Phycisphaerae bacterium]
MTIRAWGGIGGWRQFWLGMASLIAATVIWLPLVHVFFQSNPTDYRSANAIPPRAARIAQRHIRLWRDPQLRSDATALLRVNNPEWDLMSRSYLVLSLVNMSLREPDRRPDDVATVDRIIDDTLAAERQQGHFHFLLPYAHARPFTQSPVRSHHVDSQIALMLAARCVLERHEEYDQLLRDRVELMQRRMETSAVLAVESYPDECWMFDIVNGLAAMRMADTAVGTDHASFVRRWLSVAHSKLTDPRTGLMLSSFTRTGQPLDGPEGSTIWMVAHGLQLVDRDLARDQYRRARDELSETLLGFGYAREWPSSWVGPSDVDSGPPIPGLDASAGASGLALVGASAFDDEAYLAQLVTTLDFAGFPREEAGALQYCASNELGDAVLLYATVLGPLWEQVQSGDTP